MLHHILNTLFPLLFLALILGFLLYRREMRHRHLMERLHLEHGPAPVLPQPAAHAPAPDDAAALALRLPEPHRLYALALLCRLQDLAGTELDSHAAYLVSQSRSEYLPHTLRAYLNLPPAARTHLNASGQNAEQVLREQLELISRGIEGALAQDQTAARQMLTQGHFLRDLFQREGVSEKIEA